MGSIYSNALSHPHLSSSRGPRGHSSFQTPSTHGLHLSLPSLARAKLISSTPSAHNHPREKSIDRLQHSLSLATRDPISASVWSSNLSRVATPRASHLSNSASLLSILGYLVALTVFLVLLGCLRFWPLQLCFKPCAGAFGARNSRACLPRPLEPPESVNSLLGRSSLKSGLPNRTGYPTLYHPTRPPNFHFPEARYDT
ncbi:hypothetical protein CRG98_026037 [Punica granatum]|uniref:Uncharacterized protein n=1 Tax=Punica granatum TaxID=22663 RepID=A0A2I0JBG1_PUNGR|nr:hypothetical protein CRG98_026037 [Punica granatum]